MEIDYAQGLKHLARERVQQLMSSNEDPSAPLSEFVASCFMQLPPQFVFAVLREYEILAHHTYHQFPQESGMYLKLLHGRQCVWQEMDDWGTDGPWIGPLIWFHCTYLSSIGLGFRDGQELGAMMVGGDIPSPMFLADGLLYYQGIYYGDWELIPVGLVKKLA